MLKNMVALVTGGAQGLGKSTVKMFQQNGARVVLCDRPQSDGGHLAESLGNDVVFVPTDITAEADVLNALDITKKKFGRLDAVVNCGNFLVAERMFNPTQKTTQDLKVFADSLKLNTIGTFNVIRLSIALMAANEPDENNMRGVIVNAVHSAAFDGQDGETANAASNAAIVGMTLPIAREIGSIGIRILNIAPAVMNTEFYREKHQDIREYYVSMNTFPHRAGKPVEFAHMVRTIIENPMLNAETIRLDAGHRTL